ncbi:MAG: CAP domain-containing protein [Thermoleophilia bacterium]
MRNGTLRAGAGALIAGVVVALSTGTASAAQDCKPALSPADEAALTTLINKQRSAEGVSKASKDAGLRKAGRTKSLAMAKGARFAHGAGLPIPPGRAGAQNIAMAPTTVQAFQAMLNSPPHRRNMLSRTYRYLGIGVARSCDGTLYFTVNLMSPPAS